MKHSIYCCYASIEPHQLPRHYHFAFQFSYNFFLTFTHFLKNIYTFFNISISLTFSFPHYPLPYFFISPLPSTLISLFIFLFIFLFFFVLSYSQPFTINLSLFHFLHTFPSQKKGSLSLALSILRWIFFLIFLSSLLYVDKLLCFLELYIELIWFSFVI